MLALAPDEVGVWSARPDLADVDLLDLDEGRRAAAFRHRQDRARFVAGVALVRRLFGWELGVGPAEVRLDRSCRWCTRPHGPVRLADADSDLRVSVTHSADLVLVAACRGRAVGVDVERCRPELVAAGRASGGLSPNERKAWESLPVLERAAAFATIWTRKEAVLKATGMGLRLAPDELVVSAADRPAAVLAWPSGAGAVGEAVTDPEVQLLDVPVPTAYRAAVAVLGEVPVRLVWPGSAPS